MTSSSGTGQPSLDCPSDELLAAHADGTLAPDQAARIGEHLQTCQACLRIVVAVRKGGMVDPRAPVLPTTWVERYQFKRRIGAGGMGVVYEALDVSLHRAVALKVVNLEQASAERVAEAASRLVREARTMAMLSHRNIVTVFDVGIHEQRVFVAMQLVDGMNLRQWLAAAPRTPAEILRVLGEAGAGLVAAHAANVIHRDFKPDNVLVSRTGTARVSDFGLARRVELDGSLIETRERGSGPKIELHDENVTRTGVVVGTPAYIAPEQASGAACDARVDQFSFCVTAWEALYGARPFAGRTWAEIDRNVKEGNIVEPPRSPRIPGAVHRALRRGLSANPGDRFASMTELLATFGRERRRGARMLVGVAAAAVVAAGIAAFALHRASRPDSAVAKPHPLVSILIADFTNRTGDPVFDGTLEPTLAVSLETVPFISAYNRGAAHSIAAKLEPGATVLDADTAQLVATREGIALVLVGSIEPAGNGYVTRARLIDGMRGTELASASSEPEPRDAVLRSAADLGAKLAASLGDTVPESVRLAATETYTSKSLEAAHAYAAAITSEHAGDYTNAIAHCERAIALDPDMARAYTVVAVVLANRGRTQESEQYFKLALSKLGHITERERRRTRGVYFMVQGDIDHGIEELSALVKQYPADFGSAINLAAAHAIRREFSQAVEVARQVLEIVPNDAIARSNLARSLFYGGDYDRAVPELTRLVHDNPKLVRAHRVFALLELVRGHADAATTRWQTLATVGPDGSADAQLGLADLALYEGRIDDAIAMLVPAIANDLETKYTDGAALKLVTLAHAYALIGRTADAQRALEQALHASSAPAIELWAARAYIALGDDVHADQLEQQLAARVGQLRRVDALLIEGERMLALARPRDAIDKLKAAQEVVDTWLGRVDLSRAYLAAGAFAQASTEIDTALRRLPEGASALIDEQPTAYLIPELYYLQGRALEGLGSPQAADAYRQLLSIEHAAPIRDPIVLDAKQRLGS